MVSEHTLAVLFKAGQAIRSSTDELALGDQSVAIVVKATEDFANDVLCLFVVNFVCWRVLDRRAVVHTIDCLDFRALEAKAAYFVG